MKTPFYTSEKPSIKTTEGISFSEIARRAAERQEAEEKAKAEKEQKRKETLERVSGMSMKEYVEARQSGEIK
jgi:hypothetical protein